MHKHLLNLLAFLRPDPASAICAPRCTESVLSASADGFSCGDRIRWVIANLGLPEAEACDQVGLEFLAVCGPCRPSAPAPSAIVPTGTFVAPPGGRSAGYCRSAGRSKYETAAWLGTRKGCEAECFARSACLAYEWGSAGGYTRCELHSEPVTHVAPAPGGGVHCLARTTATAPATPPSPAATATAVATAAAAAAAAASTTTTAASTAVSAATTASAATGRDVDPCGPRLKKRCYLSARDDFDGSSVDGALWNVEVRNDGIRSGGDEAQYYVPEGVSVRNGALTLQLFYDPKANNGGGGTAQGQKCNMDPLSFYPPQAHLSVGFDSVCDQSDRRPPTGFFSGRINTMGKAALKHGVLEARVRLASHNEYSWSAFWLLGADFRSVGWPFCGEVEITEMWVTKVSWDNAVGKAMVPCLTAHTSNAPPPVGGWDGRDKLRWVAFNEGGYDQLVRDGKVDPAGYNVYRFEKEPDSLRWFVNDEPVAEARRRKGDGGLELRVRNDSPDGWGRWFGRGLWKPFEQPMFVIFNLAFASKTSHPQQRLDQYRSHLRDGIAQLDSASIDWMRMWEVE
ncbi:hypothetical protein EMIHUDRAFT_452459 [Emiliania huxleyi CCMP1516]|uniref:GH16 domain-containing protein n=2 Tax=Emiliania huxleyi TaxID=2903 RepID=A0A0D3IJF6_EMIH1|nr:hypothetical protein EMIHUDRAFT_452459 [Emiliania huxleyi CCMP1516]EOD11391.1 hypothetical protein EMIHUDRAFT_452459 [Emiliania huxleyi CCMP1516]|eukprot:XP_005763820.1 hypothetical protein EMIHUDRAFT_452459 [Emiliania huxleyi CCMP1516]